MKIQKIFYVLVLGLLMLTFTGSSGVMAQCVSKNSDSKSSQSCCPRGKPVSQCTPEKKAACQSKSNCDTQSQKCDPSTCSVPCDSKKDNSGN